LSNETIALKAPIQKPKRNRTTIRHLEAPPAEKGPATGKTRFLYNSAFFQWIKPCAN
jgi:hypothetical protein